MNKTNPIYIEYMPLSTLIRAPRNPKDHDLGAIGQSIDRFGFVSPLLINETTGNLAVGHGRLDELQIKKIHGEAPPKRILRDAHNEWLIPVIRGVAFDTDEEAEAYLIADNRLNEIGGWNEATLAQALSDLAAHGADMLAGVGFDMDDVDELLRRLGDSIDTPAQGEDDNDGENDKDGEDDNDENYQEQWLVLVDCIDEQEQASVLKQLTDLGLKCRALVS